MLAAGPRVCMMIKGARCSAHARAKSSSRQARNVVDQLSTELERVASNGGAGRIDRDQCAALQGVAQGLLEAGRSAHRPQSRRLRAGSIRHRYRSDRRHRRATDRCAAQRSGVVITAAIEERIRSDVEHSHEQRPRSRRRSSMPSRDGSHHYAVARCAPSRKHWKVVRLTAEYARFLGAAWLEVRARC